MVCAGNGPMKPGDVLLYPPSSAFGKLIALKTWHSISHAEVFIGGGRSVASRDGIGVGIYPARLGDVQHVLRPALPFDLEAAMRWFDTVQGQPYGWRDLLHFFGIPRNGAGMVCSPFVTYFLRAGGIPVFNIEPAEKIAPFQFLTSELLIDVTGEAGA